MSRITPMFARPTSLMVSDQPLSRLRATQRQLLEAQVQISTGKRYNRPSEVDLLLGDNSKARTQLNWEPKTTFNELVKIMVEADLGLARRELLIRDNFQQETPS